MELYDVVLRLHPGHETAVCNQYHTKHEVCSWTNDQKHLDKVARSCFWFGGLWALLHFRVVEVLHLRVLVLGSSWDRVRQTRVSCSLQRQRRLRAEATMCACYWFNLHIITVSYL